MDQLDAPLNAPPHERYESDEHISPKPKPTCSLIEHVIYDVEIHPSLLALQDEYGETFADGEFNCAEAAARRKALKEKMATVYAEMISISTKTFHTRTRCPICKQTPISINYFEMNHSLPIGAWTQWKDLEKRMWDQRPELLEQTDWHEFLGEMKTIENWYWEDNTASVECGRISWNGNVAPISLPNPKGFGGTVVASVQNFSNPKELGDSVVVNLPSASKRLPYRRALHRYSKSL
ncbi:hypothetical protein VTL71DRAFT_7429 [Oculimacula yallundae]|uniref:Uncharacterized protein n=1 Tax=Oculimacula yallundae TaxID=86028 RepID=A0ABR4BVM1_9HELO